MYAHTLNPEILMAGLDSRQTHAQLQVGKCPAPFLQNSI